MVQRREIPKLKCSKGVKGTSVLRPSPLSRHTVRPLWMASLLLIQGSLSPRRGHHRRTTLLAAGYQTPNRKRFTTEISPHLVICSVPPSPSWELSIASSQFTVPTPYTVNHGEFSILCFEISGMYWAWKGTSSLVRLQAEVTEFRRSYKDGHGRHLSIIHSRYYGDAFLYEAASLSSIILRR